jgi:uncharacterized membrane protein (DUF2068 family)
MEPTINASASPHRDTHRTHPAPRALDGLRLIALLKFGKALLVILTGYGVHRLADTALLERIHSWTTSVTDITARRLLLHALSFVEGLGAKRIQLVFAVAVAYTALVLAEGIGLWLRRSWGEWLTVCATASLIPFEIYELIIRPPGHKLAVLVTLVLNIAVVCYLTLLLRRERAAHRFPGG